MKLIYAHGFSNSEKLDWKPVVFNNVVQSFQMIFEAMNEMGIGFENPENEASKPPPSRHRRSPRRTSYTRAVGNALLGRRGDKLGEDEHIGLQWRWLPRCRSSDTS